MESRVWKLAVMVTKVGAGLVCFLAFAAIVKPEVGSKIIPKIVEFSEVYANSTAGVDLDPIYISKGGATNMSVTGLYSTRYGYLGDGIYGELVTSDTRVVAMHRFLVNYDSPMAPYAETFVVEADDAGLDWRLMAAISGVESAFGRLIPYNSYNAWGWRGGPGGDFSNFSSWRDGIEFITPRVADGYGTDIDVFEMEPTYCPPCGRNPEHAWANGVERYMGQLSEYRENL